MRFTYREEKTVKTSAVSSVFWGLVISIIFYYLGTHIIQKSITDLKTNNKFIQQGKKDVIEVPKLLPENEGKLIYTYGDISVPDELFDKDFNIKVKNSLALRVDIQMYQWDETILEKTKYNEDDTKTVQKEISYEKGWFSSHINSANFNSRYKSAYANPTYKINSRNYEQKSFILNGFKLKREQFGDKIYQYQTLALPDDLVIPTVFSINYKIHKDTIFVSRRGNSNLDNPEIGDYKINFEHIPAEKYSLLGVQKGEGVEDYILNETNKVFYLKNDYTTPEEIFDNYKESLKNGTILLIVIGLGMLIFAGLLVCAVIAIIFNLKPEQNTAQCRMLTGAMLLIVSIYAVNVISSAWSI